MNKTKLFTISTILSTILMISCNNTKLETKKMTITRQDSSTIDLELELAITQQEQQHGYMERKNIPDGTGMLFVYSEDQPLSFWMKNTPHPLSIAYIDRNGKIREIYDMKPFSEDSIQSKYSVRYALEVPQGWYSKNNINPGDILDVSMFNQ